MIILDGFEEWIKNSGLTRPEIAAKLGISVNCFNTALRTRAGFKTEVLDKICALTGLSIEQLMTWYPDDTQDLAREYKEKDVSYEKLFALMKEKGYSDYALSKVIGKSVNYIGEVRRAGNKVSIDSIKKIAELFQVKPTDLFEIIENSESTEK